MNCLHIHFKAAFLFRCINLLLSILNAPRLSQNRKYGHPNKYTITNTMETTSYFTSYNQSITKKLVYIANKIGTNPNIDDDTKDILNSIIDVLFQQTIEKR